MWLYMLIACVFAGVCWWRRTFAHPSGLPPGPRWPLPLVGDAWWLGRDLTAGLWNLRSTYGDVAALYFGHQLAVVVSGYEAVSQLLAKDEVAHRPPFPAIEAARGVCPW
jgi:hypothetical protein